MKDDDKLSQRTFTRLPPSIEAWFDREAKRLKVKKSALYRHALLEFKRGAKGVVLSQDEHDWLTIYQMFAGLAGDPVTLRAVTVIATRAFVDAVIAREVRELASRLSPVEPRSPDPDDESAADPPPRRGAPHAHEAPRKTD